MEKMIVQGEVVGKTRHKRNRIGALKVPYPRTSRVIYGVTVSGALQSIPSVEAKGVVAADYPHLDRGASALLGINILHKKTTTGGYRLRDTGERTDKSGGFGSAHERRKIEEIRKAKKSKKDLLRVPVNAGQLSLLIHSAYHSQTLYEIPAPKKPSRKTGGFMSSKEVSIMRKQRKKNEQALAPRGNIYRYHR
jgi:hypothetical protein